MKMLYATVKPPLDTNKNTEWCSNPGVWLAYLLLIFISWLLALFVSGCSVGHAWTFVNLSHFVITFKWFHWQKGTPFPDDQGMYNHLTWWEQIDDGMQCTPTRKFFTIVPIVLYLIASYTTNYENPILTFNTIAMLILVIAKSPIMHRVRLFGINADHD